MGRPPPTVYVRGVDVPIPLAHVYIYRINELYTTPREKTRVGLESHYVTAFMQKEQTYLKLSLTHTLD